MNRQTVGEQSREAFEKIKRIIPGGLDAGDRMFEAREGRVPLSPSGSCSSRRSPPGGKIVIGRRIILFPHFW